MASYPKPYKWVPKNKNKYQGDVTNIVVRSSWERKFMEYADCNTRIVNWSSESTVIPYISPVDGQYHRYFMDFKVTIMSPDMKLFTYLVEIKPQSQVNPPKIGGRKTKSYVKSVMTYGVNSAKWEAAEKYALERGWKFLILSESQLGIKK